MKKEQKTLPVKLREAFPEIKVDIAEKIDIKIKSIVLFYQSDNINKDISAVLQAEMKNHIKSKNEGKIRKKCNKLASEYLENSRICMLGENWYCLLAYLITVATLVLRVIEPNQANNDVISLFMYIGAMSLWLIIVKIKYLMGLKAERFLAAFNHHAPSLTIVSSLLFYLTVCFCTYKFVWCVVIALPFCGCLWLTWVWYKRKNQWVI